MDTSLSSAILNNMVTATLILDDGLAVRYANPAAELLFSQSAKRIVEQSLSQLIQHTFLDLQVLHLKKTMLLQRKNYIHQSVP